MYSRTVDLYSDQRLRFGRWIDWHIDFTEEADQDPRL